ncbi:tim complex component tim54 [Lasallia pustulata]|uniref:Mitochondrial import inner membrane translocase subunit TIM54 n=1 Tax=Lasallia pustulata TaxID=136370 RepID=A0A1W5DDT6_9LECA|nr:tim complex component tim54 [Lasallia pustulata]
MAEKPTNTIQDAAAAAAPKPAQPPRNPAFRMMGLPNFRFKLPSRNWLIFLSITGSFTTALLYDRHHKKKAHKKWCTIVSHMAQEPLPVDRMPRRLTIFLSAPPGDGLRAARAYFQEYVKPVLVSAALDWEVIEGRREGDVRAGLAEKVRKLRVKNGESRSSQGEPKVEEEEKESIEDALAQVRQKNGIEDWDGIQGDLIIGRNTWKEYVRGLHEGWLGPLDPPAEPPPLKQTPPPAPGPLDASVVSESTSSSPELQQSDQEKKNDSDSLPTPTPVPPSTSNATIPTPPYISPAQYLTSPLPRTLPPTLAPSLPLPFPHILGFLNTPIRVYRFLTRRHLADSTGREVAALVLAASIRPYDHKESFVSSVDVDDASPRNKEERAASDGIVAHTGHRWEQQRVLEEEEAEWHKSVRKPRKEGEETVWMEEVVVDERIGERMRRFELGGREDTFGGLSDGEPRDNEVTWVETMKIWVGMGNEKHEPKGWEQGLVGEEGD